MPLDHYVPQVHLRNFYSPSLNRKQMYGIKKSTLQKFPCRSKDVCRTNDGSTNIYLSETRVVEDFLRDIEPRYNSAVEALRNGEMDHDVAYVIAGFVSYVATCTPTAMRVHSDPLKQLVDETARIMDSQGKFRKAPDGLFGKSLTELIDEDVIRITVDRKYPQAIGITNILQLTAQFANGWWDIIVNEHARHSPFFTSDFPAAVEPNENPNLKNRIVPLAPDLAVRITGNPSQRAGLDMNFPAMRHRTLRPRASEIRAINETIVRNAEELVFFCDDHPWIMKFVKKNSRYRLEPTTKTIRSLNGGSFVVATQQVRQR